MDLFASIYLYIVFLLLAYIVDILPFLELAKKITSASQNSLTTINSSDIPDEQKQGVLLKNSLGIFKESLKIIALTFLLIALLFIFLKAGNLIKPLTYERLESSLLSFTGILISIVSFISYFIARKLYGKFRV